MKPLYKKDCQTLEKVQRMAIRTWHVLKKLNYDTEQPWSEDIRSQLREDNLIQLFKIEKNDRLNQLGIVEYKIYSNKR